MGNIKEALSHYEPSENVEQTEKELLDERMMELVLTNVRQCVEDFDFTRIFDILEELNQSEIPEKYQELFEKIRQMMDVLDVDALRIVSDGVNYDD